MLLEVGVGSSAGISLGWDAGPFTPSSFVVRRDGVVIAILPGDARTFFDLDAGPGILEAIDAGATRGLVNGIELFWDLRASPGPPTVYAVTALVGAQNITSNTVTAARDVPSLTSWRVVASDGGATLLGALERLWVDPGAPTPAIVGGTPVITARVEDFTSSVSLSTSTPISAVPVAARYIIEPLSNDGRSVAATVTGERGGQPLLQWQRSTDDSPTTWVDLPRVHGPWWFDAEAVFNEGRYYRLVVKGGEGIVATSVPARAVLWRSRMAVWGNNCILRADDAVFCAGYDPGPVSLHDVVTFVIMNYNPCALHSDAGVTCINGGVEQQVQWPPVSELVGGERLCGRTATGWVCTGNPPPLSEFDSLFPTNGGGFVCGRSNVDGGARCVANWLTLEWGDVELVGVADDQGCALADGGVRCLRFSMGAAIPVPVAPPQNSVPYVSIAVGSYFAARGFCARQADGFVRCAGEYGVAWSAMPPASEEPFAEFQIMFSDGCGVTPEGRFRCGGHNVPQLVPTQPVSQVLVGSTGEGAYFLLHDGHIAARGTLRVQEGPAPEDHFIEIADAQGAGNPVGTPSGEQGCGLRADGTVLCWSYYATPAPQPAPGKRYLSIGMSRFASCGLEAGGSISCWRGGWTPTGSYVRLMTVHEALCGVRADRTLSCDRAFTPAPPVGTAFDKVAANGTEGCGIRIDGFLECWPSPAPPWALSRRFRDVAASASSFCAVASDGETRCWGGVVTSPPWRDLLTVTMSDSIACGLRSDQTATCWAITSWPWRFPP